MKSRVEWLARKIKRFGVSGRLGGSLSWTSDFGSGHDLTVHEFEPGIRLCADSSEPGACFGFCVSLCLCPSPARALSLSLSQKINKHWGAWVAQSVEPPTSARSRSRGP